MGGRVFIFASLAEKDRAKPPTHPGFSRETSVFEPSFPKFQTRIQDLETLRKFSRFLPNKKNTFHWSVMVLETF